MTNDLTAARDAVLQGRLRAADALAANLAHASAPGNTHTYIRRFDAQALAAAQAVDSQFAVKAPMQRLAGLAVSVKDLFDVQGQPTTAASRVLAKAPAAAADCPAVARLRAAGASLTGHTNMTEFAFSGVGINPHHGTPPNAATLALDPQPRIPGGSTSGGAVSVASGAAWAALGSDTGGSIRIPAALQGLVGFKNTARLTPTEGAIPLSTTLDTACAITLSVRDAVLLHEILADRPVMLTHRPLSAWRLGLPVHLLDGMDTAVASAFQRALATLRHAGARIEEISLPEMDELAAINATGGFSAAESWAWHRKLLTQHPTDYDPRVAQRIRRGASMSAADYIDLQHARAQWITQMTLALRPFDALLSPTVPVLAPTMASLSTDEAFFATNSLLLRNPSIANMLDGCALSLPCHRPGEMPVGLMVWSHALQDDTVLDVSLAIERALAEGGR
jgi:amidase/aspartyl-tRNA(Asn)/glutamyl-tRNA(Gln) amidotransferase subunit A